MISLISTTGPISTNAYGKEGVRDESLAGGYILAPEHSYHCGLPVENIGRALKSGTQFGAYPLDVNAIHVRLEELGQ